MPAFQFKTLIKILSYSNRPKKKERKKKRHTKNFFGSRFLCLRGVNEGICDFEIVEDIFQFTQQLKRD